MERVKLGVCLVLSSCSALRQMTFPVSTLASFTCKSDIMIITVQCRFSPEYLKMYPHVNKSVSYIYLQCRLPAYMWGIHSINICTKCYHGLGAFSGTRDTDRIKHNPSFMKTCNSSWLILSRSAKYLFALGKLSLLNMA